MGVTNREQEMLDLADEGMGVDEIARRMGISRYSVTQVLGRLSWSRAADVAREAAIRAGSQRLAAAIAAGGYR
jgi:DNA-binding NarL/FixJ family response regulator